MSDEERILGLIEKLRSRSDSTCRKWKRELVKIGEPAVGPLIMRLNDADWFVHERVAETLIRIGKPAVPQLLAALKSKDADVRNWTADVLGQIGDDSTIPALIETLGDEAVYVRFTAIEALGEFNDARAVSALIHTLMDENPDVREIAVRALGGVGDCTLPQLYRAALENPELSEQLRGIIDSVKKGSKRPSGVRKVDPRPREFSLAARGMMLGAGTGPIVRLGR